MEPLLQWEVISITYYNCVSVVLFIQHTKYMHHVAICGISGVTVFFHIIS